MDRRFLTRLEGIRNAPPRRPTTRLENILSGILWAVLCCGSWLVWRLEGPDEHWLMPFALPLALLMFGGPFIAVGALFGRTMVGVLVAIVVFGIVVVAFF